MYKSISIDTRHTSLWDPSLQMQSKGSDLSKGPRNLSTRKSLLMTENGGINLMDVVASTIQDNCPPMDVFNSIKKFQTPAPFTFPMPYILLGFLTNAIVLQWGPETPDLSKYLGECTFALGHLQLNIHKPWDCRSSKCKESSRFPSFRYWG